MGLKPTATDAKRLLPILDPDFKDLDPDQLDELKKVALAAMEEALAIFEAKAKFTVVGQVMWEDGKTIKSFDPAAEKVCVGVFNTETQAKGAADQLFGSPNSREVLRTWVLPIHHGTPAQWRKARKEALEAERLALAGGTQAEGLSKLIAERGFARCEREVPNDEGDFVQCVRPVNHAGACFSKIPSMNGVE